MMCLTGENQSTKVCSVNKFTKIHKHPFPRTNYMDVTNIESIRQWRIIWRSNIWGHTWKYYLPYLFLMEQKSFLFIFSSATPQKTVYSAIPDGSHLKTSSLCRLRRLLDSNPGLLFHNLVLLPLSHHCSQMSHHCSNNEPPLLPLLQGSTMIVPSI